MLKIDSNIFIECEETIKNDLILKKLFDELKDARKEDNDSLLFKKVVEQVKLSFDKEAYHSINDSFGKCYLRFKNVITNVIETMLHKTKLFSLPLVVHLEVTNRCNAHCIMCGRVFQSTKSHSIFREKEIEKNDFSFDLFKKCSSIFQYISDLVLVGWGEPFLNPNFIDMIEEAKKFDVGVKFTTNGDNLGSEDFLSLIRKNNNIFSINISFDGATEATFNSIRKGIDFQRVVKNIIKINELKKIKQLDYPKLNFNFVAMKRNIKELLALIDLAAPFNISAIVVSYLTVHGKELMCESLFYDKGLANSIFAQAEERAREKGIVLILPKYFKIENTNSNLGKDSRATFNGCSFPWSFSMIDAVGNVKPCCAYEQSFGNLKKDNFKEIWNNEEYQKFRGNFVNNKIPVFCRSCPNESDVDNKNTHFHIV